jgi:hypothetical protein
MTIKRPMFPPVDPTRRHFLSVAAAGTVAAAIPTAATIAPAMAGMHPDAELIELGKKFDAAVAEYTRIGLQIDEIDGRIWAAVQAEVGEMPQRWKDYSDVERQRSHAAHQRAVEEIGGDNFEALQTAQYDAAPGDELSYAIGRMKAHTIEGYAVKARVVAHAFSECWDEPFRDLDWGPKNVCMLVESILEAAGLPKPEAPVADAEDDADDEGEEV